MNSRYGHIRTSSAISVIQNAYSNEHLNAATPSPPWSHRLVKALVAIVTGTLGAALCAAGTAQAADSSSKSGGPDVSGLKQALSKVVAAGAPGVFARIEDSVNGHVTKTDVSVGTGNLATDSPVDPQGRFRIGSITKNFTAVMVLKMVAAGRADLDSPATGYLPAGLLPAGSAITVRDLLDHRSGLYDYTNDLLHQQITGPLHLSQTSYVVPRTGIAAPHAVGYLAQDDPAKGLSDATDQSGAAR